MTLVNKRLGLALIGAGLFYLGFGAGTMVQLDLDYRHAARNARRR